ncbi:adenosine/AMP deaminase domain-containing protein [Phthorimaea operculella]|nr:adenosine/AMP deaminase domain-containing protein [Phthorimaea operculella]
MPKGALLHVHGSAILGADFFMNVTYRDNLYICFEQDDRHEVTNYKPRFKFASTVPDDLCESSWELLSDVRKRVDNVQDFDAQMRRNLTLVGTDFHNSDSTWNHFQNIFVVIHGLLSYRPVHTEYWHEALTKLKEDKIMYLEVRSILYELYELDGTTHNSTTFLNDFRNIVNTFKSNNPDFIGAKIICAYSRSRKFNDLDERIEAVKEAKREFPDIIAGFDLVGHEDSGRPLKDHLRTLEKAKNELDYFFHAGETNWYGTDVDENLIDAIRLESKRIGHGYALTKHPLLMEEVKIKGICIEVSVISNSVLGYNHDARSHPLATLLAWGVKSVIAGDDPGLWEAPLVSADLYVTFAGVASRRHDLRLLKQLALNSIECSALSVSEKESALAMFENQWRSFVTDFVVGI